MRISSLCVLVSFGLLLSSCSDEDSKKSSIKYKGYVPNFSVNAPDTSASRGMLKSRVVDESLESLAHEETSGARIDCSAQLENWNTISTNPSYSFPMDAAGESVAACSGGRCYCFLSG